MTNDKVRQALQWLDDEGWSELIDPRWTLEVYHELQTSKLDLSDADIREALDLVIYDKPDYNPANNERLIRGMTEESPKYRDYITLMQQCKAEAEKEHPKYKGFHDLSEPHEKADDILCNLLTDLGFKEIVELYKSFENGMRKQKQHTMKIQYMGDLHMEFAENSRYLNTSSTTSMR